VVTVYFKHSFKVISMDVNVFICDLFNDAVSSSDYIASNVRVINE
jgi:hypothetical protein